MPPIPEQVGANEEGYRKGFIAKLLKPLKDFGFGSRSFWEGGVGLFIFAGIGAPSLSYMRLSAIIFGIIMHKK